ncbi:DUF418 domain-containing protein [Paenibacillus sp. H1-7]|uniref:DUF418 domain-containing protein n=1 Tax=Paenibacillus sp. H1-7 TaxID=2282849 RepID=UPI001EF85B25|nr:DUF418 domain-containing protein [Paenibacillus sp. H1-7]ULL19298.1 DUF418 domain-containing protein [Paenibacillus sp. H1-7]
MNALQPAGERIVALDVIRGFAVMGIFIVNVPEMIGSGGSFIPVHSGFDAVIRLLYDMLFQTKFYTIFSFLFGLGFYLFMQSAERKGLRPKRLFARRLLLLLLFGIAHAVLLWFGDVLYTYAIIGFLLMPFYKRTPKTVLIWALSLLALFTVLIVLVSVSVYQSSLSGEISKPLFTQLPDMGDRLRYLLGAGIANALLRSFEVLGLFLLGVYAGKKGWFDRDRWNPAVVRRVQWIALAVSAVLFIPMLRYFGAYDAYYPEAMYHFTYLSGKTMAVFYVCTLLRLLHRYSESRFQGLASVGRMALTHYLTQTIVTMIVLQFVRSYAGQIPLWAGTMYCIVIFAAQIAVSKVWFRHYRMGPAEWLWRAGTYGRKPAFRRVAPPYAEQQPSAKL